MFEGVVAGALNRWLGKYVADLDTERLNVGIFSGRVSLADLRLKPEALYELGLPIEVKTGTVGKLELVIPWGGLRAQPVVVVAEDVLVLAGPATGRDAERERRLLRAARRSLLEALEAGAEAGARRRLDDLLAALLHKVHICVRNVHVRYEDSTSCRDGPFAAGFCLQSLSIETTNSKWKPCGSNGSTGGGGVGGVGGGGGSVYQMVRLDAVSAYWNARATVLDERETEHMTPIQYYNWKHHMLTGLRTFSVHGEPFHFLLRPVSCKVKVIVKGCGGGGGGGGGGVDARAPLLLVDAVLQDGGVQVHRAQLLSMRSLMRAFRRIHIARKHRALRPMTSLAVAATEMRSARAWWMYAYRATVEQRVRPYTWAGVKRHRHIYNRYKQAYKAVLRSPADTELRLDLHKCEDDLPILSAVVAREHAKMELAAEEPSRVEVVTGAGEAAGGAELRVRGLRTLTSLWSQISSPEKAAPPEQATAPTTPAPPRTKHYIEHKVNVTLGNWSLALSRGGGSSGGGAGGGEVLLVTLAHFVASLETRPAPGAYKISARVESVSVEGAGGEGELVPLVWADPAPTVAPPAPAPPANLLSLDWERRPPSGEADFALVAALEPIEIVYNQHAVSEVLRFLESRDARGAETAAAARQRARDACHAAATAARRALRRTKLLSLNLELKGVCLVLPEHGSIHKCGSVLVVEAERVSVRSELQPSTPALEDATCMELEERLYDRLHADCPALQVLFCEEGERWRELRKLPDSELHLLPRMRLQLVFSNTIVPTYISLPRHKLNVTVSSLKLNLCERSALRLAEFADHLPAPLASDVTAADRTHQPTHPPHLLHLFQIDRVQPDPGLDALLCVRTHMVAAYITRTRGASEGAALAGESGQTAEEAAPARSGSEPSDEEAEVYARTVDLPGFDDNVSPTNTIRVLLRFVIGEVVLSLSRCVPPDTSERSYAMAAVSGVCVDAALMEYGPAVQLSVRSLLLSDKLHRAAAGQYLHLLSTGEDEDFLTLLYRKVRADCPDFKSHFHSVEQSLVADVGTLHIGVHAEALHHVYNYTLHLYHIVRRPRVVRAAAAAVAQWWGALRERAGREGDPPVPSGAVKFSYSARVSCVSARLYHLDSEVLEARAGGLESDCVFKANDRLIFKLFLGTLQVDHLADLTLYPKLVWGGEDKVLEIKYVRHAPRVYTPRPGGAAAALGDGGDGGGGEADGSLRLYLGRVHILILYKLLLDLQHMWANLSASGLARWATEAARTRARAAWARGRDARLALAIDLRAPTLLMPRGCASPDLLVLNCGDLVVENFFKAVCVGGESAGVVDNLLLRLSNVTLARAVMTLAGALHLQEPILEPMEVRVDVKRRRRGAGGGGGGEGSAPVEADATLDAVLVNVGRRDLAALLALASDYSTLAVSLGWGRGRGETGAAGVANLEQESDSNVEKLQAFFAKTEPVRKEISLRVCLEGVAVKLFSDAEEVLSSPVREATRGVARLAFPELTLHLHTYSDTSLELRAALNSLTLQDMRPTPNLYFQRVLEGEDEEVGGEEDEGAGGAQDSDGISVWSPPLAELEWRRSCAGDHSLHLQVERTRLYFSVPFFLHLARFFLDAIPGERTLDVTGGIVNHGYEGEAPGDSSGHDGDIRPSLSPNSTSGCCSSGAWFPEEAPGVTVSVRFRRPELVLPANGGGGGGAECALLFRAELLMDYSRHAAAAAGETLTVSLSGLEAAWKSPYSLRGVLQSCDVELSRSRRADEGVRAALSLSAIDVTLSPPVLHALTGIVEEVRGETSGGQEDTPPPVERGDGREEDLWSPRKLEPQDLECEQLGALSPHAHALVASPAVPETFTFNAPNVRVILQLQPHGVRGAISVDASLEGTVWEWSGRAHGGATLSLHANVYNERADVWEPLVEPTRRADGTRTPWRLHCHFFQAKSYPMCSESEDVKSRRVVRPADNTRGASMAGAGRRPGRRKRCSAGSGTSADEAESDGEMSFLRSRPLGEGPQGVAAGPTLPLRTALPTDDSDDEEERLTAAVTRLFADESSGEDSSEGDESSSAERSEPEPEPESTTGAGAEAGVEAGGGKRGTDEEPQRNTNAIQEQAESSDSGLVDESWRDESSATYVVVHAPSTLDLTVTPHAAAVCGELVAALTDRAADTSATLPPSTCIHLELINDIGPGATVQLVSSVERDVAGRERVLAAAEWDADADTSRASSPSADNIYGGTLTRHWHWPEGVTAPYRGRAAAETEDSAGDEGDAKPTRGLYAEMPPERVVLQLLEREELRVVCPRRDISLLLPLMHRARPRVRYHVRLERTTRAASRVLVLRSPLQIRNETSYPLELLYRKTDLETLGLATPGELTNPFVDKLRLTVIEPHHTYNMPLHVAYHCPLFLLPTNLEAYRPAARGIWWRELAAEPETARDVVCQAKADGDSSVFALRVLIAPGAGGEYADAETPDCVIRALPPLVLHNRLPYAVQLHLPHLDYSVRLEPGERTRTHLVDLTRSHTMCMEMSYRGISWSGELALSAEWRERRVRMRGEGGEGGGGDRPAVCSRLECAESWELYLHAPYWIINKTGLPLHMKVSRCDGTYEVGDEPLLFGSEWRGGGAAAARRTVRLRAHLSAWSRAFSLDAVGAPGLVVCHHRERRRKYRILLETRLSEVCPRLTRTVMLLPYYTIHNDTRRHLRYMEENEAADLWLELPPGHCTPFWPETVDMRLHCKLRDSPALSQHFPLAAQHFTVLRMDKGSALSVEVTGGEWAPWRVRLRAYREGDAPVLVHNLTADLFIKLHQRDLSQVVLLNPLHSSLYTWDDPCAERTLLCNVYNNKTDSFPVHIHHDGYGEEKVNLYSVKHSPLAQTSSVTSKLSSTLKMFAPRARSPDPPSSSASGDDSDTESTVRTAPRRQCDALTLHWVSYREGPQRVLALTDDERVARRLRSRLAFTERSHSELYVSLGGLGLSLCADHGLGLRELAYLSLSGSVPRWEANLSRRWRLLAPDLTAAFEERYAAGGADGEMRIRDYVHADLERMHMSKPFFSELRRTWSPALWLQVRRSATLVHLRALTHRLQVDDQRPDAVFPCVLYPAPAESAHSVPCLQLSVRRRRNSACYERVDVNVQPCCVNLELGFVRSALRLASVWCGQEQPVPAVRLRADLALVHAPLASLACPPALNAADAPLFSRVRVSPLRCTLSLSCRGESAETLVARSECQESRFTPPTFNGDLIDFMLESWGATLGNVKGVQLSAPALETGEVRGWRRAIYAVRRHCTTRLLEQFHATVLRLDVLTNRLAAFASNHEKDVCGVGGEEEAAEGAELARKLEYGVSVLLGHCASGAPRAAPLLADCPPAAAAMLRRARITTTLTMAAWCAAGRSAADAGAARGAEEPPGTAPPPHPAEITVALLALVARPTPDEDCTLIRNVYREAVRECSGAGRRGGGGGAAEWALRSAEERSGGRLVARRRLPRHCSPYQGVEAYSTHSALGEVLLRSARAHADRADSYLAHATLAPAHDTRRAIIVTTRRVLCMRVGADGGGGGRGGWRVEWWTRLERLAGVPVLSDNKLLFNIQQQESSGYGEEDDGSGEERAVESSEREVLRWLRERVRAALLLRLEQQRITPPL